MVVYIPVVRFSTNKFDVFYGRPCPTMQEAIKVFKQIVFNRHYEPNRSYIGVFNSVDMIESKDVLLPIYKIKEQENG